MYYLEQKSLLVKRSVALISSRGPSVGGYELMVAVCTAANSITAAQQFRCSYDMNSNVICHIILV